MTPLDEALALLRESLDAIEEIHTDRCSAWCGYRELRTNIRAFLESAAAQDNKASTASTGAEPMAPSSGSLPNTPGPASATPTPLTDAMIQPLPGRDCVTGEPIDVVHADDCRDLERKLVEAQRDAERYRYLRQIDRCLDWEILLQCKAGTITGSEQIDAAIDEAMRGKPTAAAGSPDRP